MAQDGQTGPVRDAALATIHATVVALYKRAFAEYRSHALWNVTEYDDPTLAEALAITRQLRTEGDMGARRIAEQIEALVRANH